MKNLIILLTFAIFSVACEKSILKITQPDDSFFLGKLKTIGNNFTVSNGGKNITVDGKNYEFEKKITGIAGIYKNENATNGADNEYMFVFPVGDEAHTVSASKEEKEAIEDIIDIVGEENSASIIQEILTNEEKLDANKIAENFPDKKDAIQNVIDNLYKNSNKTNFGSYKKYPEQQPKT